MTEEQQGLQAEVHPEGAGDLCQRDCQTAEQEQEALNRVKQALLTPLDRGLVSRIAQQQQEQEHKRKQEKRQKREQAQKEYDDFQAFEALVAAVRAESQRVRSKFWGGGAKANEIEAALSKLLNDCDQKTTASDKLDYFERQLASSQSLLYQSLNKPRLPFSSAKKATALIRVEKIGQKTINKTREQKTFQALVEAVRAESQRVRSKFWGGRAKANEIEAALSKLLNDCDQKRAASDKVDYFVQQLTSPQSLLYQSLNKPRLPFSSGKPATALIRVQCQCLKTMNQWDDRCAQVSQYDSSTQRGRGSIAFKALASSGRCSWSTMQDLLKDYDKKKHWWSRDHAVIKMTRSETVYRMKVGLTMTAKDCLSHLVYCIEILQFPSVGGQVHQFYANLLRHILPDNDILSPSKHGWCLNVEYTCMSRACLESLIRDRYFEVSVQPKNIDWVKQDKRKTYDDTDGIIIDTPYGSPTPRKMLEDTPSVVAQPLDVAESLGEVQVRPPKRSGSIVPCGDVSTLLKATLPHSPQQQLLNPDLKPEAVALQNGS